MGQPMDRFLSIQAFVRVAEAESFAEAARQLGVANSVVTQRIKQLEEFIDTPLFHRSTRSVKLSEIGAEYYKECAELVARLDGLTDHMREIKGSPTGTLRITVLPGIRARSPVTRAAPVPGTIPGRRPRYLRQ